MRIFLTFLVALCVLCGTTWTAHGFLGIDVCYPDEISCATQNDFVKCARLPATKYYENAIDTSCYANIDAGTEIDDMNWTHFRNGVPIVGHAENVTTTKMSNGIYWTTADCVVTEPFRAQFSAAMASGYAVSGARTCIYYANTADLFGEAPGETPLIGVATALDGDVCPDGFYRVPYESWCDYNMVNIAGVPNCDEDTSGEYCLQDAGSATAPCASGISNIRTSTGLSFQLYAEKYTEPALAVKYNGSICWCNLELGIAENAINVMVNNVVYHTMN